MPRSLVYLGLLRLVLGTLLGVATLGCEAEAGGPVEPIGDPKAGDAIDGGGTDGADDAGVDAGRTPEEDAAVVDAAVEDGGPDDGGATMDSGPPDAGVPDEDDAAAFCTRYEEVCGFGDVATRYADFDTCVSAYEGYVDVRQNCVESHLSYAETGEEGTHCPHAAGSDPCN